MKDRNRSGLALLTMTILGLAGCEVPAPAKPSASPKPASTGVPAATPRPSAAPSATPTPSLPPGATPAPSPVPTGPGVGSVELTLVADLGAAANVVVSAGIPFAPGVLRDEALVSVRDPAGAEIPIQSAVLGRWSKDGSIRSVLVMFRATLAASAKAGYRVTYGSARTVAGLSGLAPNPDGPIAATLPASWYSASEVSGKLVPVAENTRFRAYDTALEQKLFGMSPAYSTYVVNCATTTAHRTYYDGVHAIYQLFLRYGDAKHYRRAREEAKLYRVNELRWSNFGGYPVAIHICQPANWTPASRIDWGVLRRLAVQGNLDDYLVTGDAEAGAAVRGMGEAYRQNLPVLQMKFANRSFVELEVTERNLGWTLMGLANYYALDPRAEVQAAMKLVADRAIAWQAKTISGAMEHSLPDGDPDECSNAPNGASPFMTSLVVDGMMDYYQLTGDARVADFVLKVARWYETSAITSDGLAFRYLWNCLTDPYDDSENADLNILINHVFGAAYALSRDPHWLDFGDKMADSGIDAIFVSRPKQWNQAARSFGKYLGYRAALLKP